jgi:4-aminobutyrate aminotransferase-like enzyme
VALGKSLGNGFPVSACVGRAEVMARWGTREVEAIHTSTHLGNPMGCAVARATLEAIERDALAARAEQVGERWIAALRKEFAPLGCVVEVRGRGLMLGVELDTPERSDEVVERALQAGWILIQAGPDGRVLSLTPPLNVSESLLERATGMLLELLSK